MKISRAQIVATIGPASGKPAVLRRMIAHQMDVVRLNFSHGSYQQHEHFIHMIRAEARRARRKIPIIQDLSGPRVKGKKGGHHVAKYVHSSITQKDVLDLEFGLFHDVDYVAMSYVGSAADILHLRSIMRELGSVKPIIAKIERKVAVDRLPEILKAADAVMIARGDLANEVSLGEIPFVEKNIILAAKKAKKPVITATQMMLSMVNSPSPTRAEATDVAYAISLGSDAVMLSEESAVGKYPVQTVMEMEKIIRAAEKHLGKTAIHRL